jgi:hypothetical protein
MLANFPAAAALVALAFHIASAYVVTVDNRSPWIVDLSFQSNGQTYAFGTIPPRAHHEDTLRFPQEREVLYSLALNGATRKGIFDGYVAGWNNKATLRISETGDVFIRHERF